MFRGRSIIFEWGGEGGKRMKERRDQAKGEYDTNYKY